MKLITALLAVSLLVSGCAASPKRIEPQYVAQANYDEIDCAKLKTTQHDLEQQLGTLSTDQQHSHTADAIFVTVGTLVAWPVYFALLATDNHKDEIARLKGEDIAMAGNLSSRCK